MVSLLPNTPTGPAWPAPSCCGSNSIELSGYTTLDAKATLSRAVINAECRCLVYRRANVEDRLRPELPTWLRYSSPCPIAPVFPPDVLRTIGRLQVLIFTGAPARS